MRTEQIDALIKEHLGALPAQGTTAAVSLASLRKLVRAAAPAMPEKHAKMIRRRRDFLGSNGVSSWAVAERNALDWVLDRHETEPQR